MIRDKVLSYMIEHSGRLNASMNVRTKRPITGKKITKNQGSHEPGLTLKDASDGLGIFVGSAMKFVYMQSDALENEQYNQTFLEEFDSLTTENWCKPKQMLKSDSQSLSDWSADFENCQFMNEFAIQNEIAHRGHALVWPSPGKYPEWLEEKYYDKDGLYKDELENFMIDWIITVMHEMGELYAWDVVSGCVSNAAKAGAEMSEYLKDTVWYPIDDFICTAFKTAKTVSQLNGWETLLFYNDYNFNSAHEDSEFFDKSENVYDLVKYLVDNDCGIDGVGFQTHLDIGFSDDDIQGMKSNF